MMTTAAKSGLLKIVKDPILRINKEGLITECHFHETSSPAFISADLQGKNIDAFDFFNDLKPVIDTCIEAEEPQSAYFSVKHAGKKRHYEALLEQDDESILILIKEITKKRQQENKLLEYFNLLHGIHEGTSSSTGNDYLDQLTYQLSKALKADYTAICISKLEDNLHILESVSIHFGGFKLDNTNWLVEGSPFQQLNQDVFLQVKQGFKNKFPGFILNSQYTFNGFIGVPLFYNQKYDKPVGYMFALYELPLLDQEVHHEKILRIFSSRAAAELERIENQKKIEFSEQRFKALYNNTPAYFTSTDEEGFIIEIGDYFIEKAGYNRSEIVGKNALDFLTRESKIEGIKRVIPEFLRNGYCRDIALNFVKKGGEIMEVMLSATMIKDQEGNFVKTIMNLNDVTLLRRTERELRKSEEKVIEAANRFKFLFNNTPVGIIIHTNGIIKHVNSETIRLARGNSIHDFIGKKALSFVHPDSKQAAQERIDRIYSTKKAHRNEQKFLCVDGSVIEVEAMGTLIDYDGIPSMQIAFYDISDRKNAERRILERDKELGALNENLAKQNNQLEEFAHIASHNLRAPITNMLSLIKIREADPSLATQQFVWENIGKTVRNLDETIIELNDVVKTSWELDKQRKTLYFQDVLEKILNSIVDQIAKADAEFDVVFELDKIYYPKVYLESILQNLLTNAIKYKKPDVNSFIELRSWIKNGRGYLSIRDNGMGIDLEKYGSRLFGLRKTFHDNDDARGVGLFITKAQIESLGGGISVESQEGIGTKFIVDFGTLKLISTGH